MLVPTKYKNKIKDIYFQLFHLPIAINHPFQLVRIPAKIRNVRDNHN